MKKKFVPDRYSKNSVDGKPDFPIVGSEYPGIPENGNKDPRKFFQGLKNYISDLDDFNDQRERYDDGEN